MMNVSKKLIELDRIYLVLLGVSVAVVISLLTSFIANYLEPNSLNNELVEGRPLYQKFLLVIGVAPFLETLIYQFGIIELLQHISRKLSYKNLLSILISAGFFGLSHWGSNYYILFSFLMGIILAYFYLIGRSRKDISPFFLVFLIHLSVNSVAFIANEFL